MSSSPYDQRLARIMVRPLARAGVSPNQVTTATLVLALAGAGLIALGAPAAHWGAGLFVLARFFDHFDGELARRTGRSSRFGYYYDHVVGGISYACLFLAIGIGQTASLGWWALLLGGLGGASALISLYTNLELERTAAPEAAGYPGFAGFELEDGIYLIAPVTWLGLLPYFLVPAGLGAGIYCGWTVVSLMRARRQR